jgi:hypothetical protein
MVSRWRISTGGLVWWLPRWGLRNRGNGLRWCGGVGSMASSARDVGPPPGCADGGEAEGVGRVRDAVFVPCTRSEGCWLPLRLARPTVTALSFLGFFGRWIWSRARCWRWWGFQEKSASHDSGDAAGSGAGLGDGCGADSGRYPQAMTVATPACAVFFVEYRRGILPLPTLS